MRLFIRLRDGFINSDSFPFKLSAFIHFGMRARLCHVGTSLCIFGTLPGICGITGHYRWIKRRLNPKGDNARIRFAVCRVKNRAATAGALRHLKANPKLATNARLTFDRAAIKLSIRQVASRQKLGKPGLLLAGCQELRKHRLRPQGKGALIAIGSESGNGKLMKYLAAVRRTRVKSKQLTIEGAPATCGWPGRVPRTKR